MLHIEISEVDIIRGYLLLKSLDLLQKFYITSIFSYKCLRVSLTNQKTTVVEGEGPNKSEGVETFFEKNKRGGTGRLLGTQEYISYMQFASVLLKNGTNYQETTQLSQQLDSNTHFLKDHTKHHHLITKIDNQTLKSGLILSFILG